MIAEINAYEVKCIDAFGKKSPDFKQESMQLSTDINSFYYVNVRHLKEFTIDAAKVQDGVVLADYYLEMLKKEELKLKKIKFDGKLMEFKKNEIKPTKNLLVLFDFKNSSFDFETKFKIQFSDEIVLNYHSSFNLIKLEDETNAAFYINTSYFVTMVVFDNAGQVISQDSNLFSDVKLRKLKVFKSVDKYLISVAGD
jgi:hypothetical protein